MKKQNNFQNFEIITNKEKFNTHKKNESTNELSHITIEDIKENLTNYIENNSYDPLLENKTIKENKEKFKIQLLQHINSLSKNQLVIPRKIIIGTIIEYLKYTFDEEYIKNMYLKLLTKEIDARTHNKVMLCFMDMIKQLNKNDVDLLTDINAITKERKTDRISICLMKERAIDTTTFLCGSVKLDILLVDNKGKESERIIKPNPVSLENLERLNIININYDNYLTKDEDKIRETFNYYKKDYEEYSGIELFCEPGIIEITNLGRNFINLCIEE